MTLLRKETCNVRSYVLKFSATWDMVRILCRGDFFCRFDATQQIFFFFLQTHTPFSFSPINTSFFPPFICIYLMSRRLDFSCDATHHLILIFSAHTYITPFFPFSYVYISYIAETFCCDLMQHSRFISSSPYPWIFFLFLIFFSFSLHMDMPQIAETLLCDSMQHIFLFIYMYHRKRKLDVCIWKIKKILK